MSGQDSRPFRDRAAAFFLKHLGPAQELQVESGTLYRWVVTRRGRNDLHIYITLDSPELPDYAHLLISNPDTGADPIQSIMLRTEAELEPALALIRAQADTP